MKICITSCGKDLGSKVDPHFGRSPYFIIWDNDKKISEIVENPNIDETSGVGIKSAQLMADLEIKTILTGKIGPKAAQVLESAKIKVIEDVSGTIKEVIEIFESGNLKQPINLIKANELQEEVESEAKLSKCLFQRKGCGQNRHGGGKQGRNCICLKCGEKIAHIAGIPCRSQSCPKCGSQMIRQ